MTNTIFNEADEEIKLLQEILKVASKYLPNTYTPTILYLHGLTIYNKTVVPINSVSHNVMFESFNKTFFSCFNSLFNKVYEERHYFTSEFAFRTLIDMGVKNSFLMFNDSVDKLDHDRFVLISLIADNYDFKKNTTSEFKDWFDKLYKDYGNILTEKEKEKIAELVLSKNDEGHAHSIKTIRNMSGEVRNNLIDKYSSKRIFNKTLNLVMLDSGLSHTLHGNVFLIENMLKDTSHENHLFRVYGNLFICGMEFLKNFCGLTKDDDFKKVVNSFIIHNNEFRKKFEQTWKNLPKPVTKIEIVTRKSSE